MDKNRQGQRRIIRCYVSGSYTVEMAFVFPIILGILFAILFVLFYKHDELMVQHNLREGLLQHEDTLPKKQEWKSELQANLWMGQVKSCEIKQNIKEIRGN
ncbi:MAG: pilus assembly protein, partial [Lachnospiraceae bacterium]|nr:pilus assembly protein [Lachnospiraceae bacterium]